MSRLRKSKARVTNYKDEDSDDETDLGVLSLLNYLILQRGRKSRTSPLGLLSRKKLPPKKPRKTNKKRASNRRANMSLQPSTSTSTSTNNVTTMEIDSEDELVSKAVANTHTANINTKVDSFFKGLESDDDDNSQNPVLSKKPTELKDKDFYTVLSDDEDLNLAADIKESACVNKEASQNLPKANSPQKTAATSSKPSKIEDILAYVDEVLNECSEVVDISEDKSKENAPVYSLEQFKIKSDEIVNDVASYIKECKSEEPKKEVPSCPVCFEDLVNDRQAMVTLCGHMFCEPCLKEVVKTTKKCPSCRKGLTKTKYHPVYL